MRISDWSSDVCSSDLTGTEDSALVIDVLGNDSSPGGGALTVAAVTQGANGSVTINPDNSLTYTPAADFLGTDSFAYTVSDDAGSETATVSVTVTPLRSEEHTSGLQSLMRISYAVFCLKKKITHLKTELQLIREIRQHILHT